MVHVLFFLTQTRASLLSSAASIVLLTLSSACTRPDCIYYQYVDIESEVLESSEKIRLLDTSLHVNPEDEEYLSTTDSFSILLESGVSLRVAGIMYDIINGRTELTDRNGSPPEISVYSLENISCRGADPKDSIIRIESSEVVGNVHDDRVDPDFQSSSVLYLKADDPDFLSKCGLEQPFEVRVRLTTDASMVKEKTAPSIHGCRER